MVVETRMTLTPQFAVPVAEAFLKPCEALNTELEKLFLARETDAHRNPMPSHTPQQELFESRFNLFHWPELYPQLRPLSSREWPRRSCRDDADHTGPRTPEVPQPHLVPYHPLRRLLRRPQPPDGLLVGGVLRACRGSCRPARQRPAPTV